MTDYNLYWGDIHIHSNVSHRCFKFGLEPEGFDGSPKDCYRYCRDVAGMDFGAVTDHDCTRGKREMRDDEWDIIRATAASMNGPGRFITFTAFEWSCQAHGHQNVYYLNDDAPLLGCDEYPTPADLWEALTEVPSPSITVPHHVARDQTPTNWDYFDPAFVPIVEITSCWGNYEHEGNAYECDPNWSPSLPGHFIRDGLARGYKFGFVGGGDIHTGHAGGHLLNFQTITLPPRWESTRRYRRNPLGGGIAGVYARELTRQSIFEALRARRCIAATNAKIAIHFMVDDVFMGGEIALKNVSDRPRQIVAEIHGTQPIRGVDIIRNGHILIHFNCSRMSETIRHKDAYPLLNVRPVIRDASGRRLVYYYVRVTQVDEKMAWASPVWLSFRDD